MKNLLLTLFTVSSIIGTTQTQCYTKQQYKLLKKSRKVEFDINALDNLEFNKKDTVFLNHETVKYSKHGINIYIIKMDNIDHGQDWELDEYFLEENIFESLFKGPFREVGGDIFNLYVVWNLKENEYIHELL